VALIAPRFSSSVNSGGSITGPGRTAFTRTFGLRWASSTAMHRVIVVTAPLLGKYAAYPRYGRTSAQSPTFTIAPPSGCLVMARPTCWQVRNVPRAFASKCFRTSAAVTSSSGLLSQIAAQFTSTSMRPNLASTSCTSFFTAASSARSAANASAATPSVRSAATVSAASAAELR